ncbi:MAG: tetratricopeptide repeat protein, partial [Deltaproteobacteria bacterium]|nr:tetratricopeptide repeat protein [Deltaproteobacteria bacterium]
YTMISDSTFIPAKQGIFVRELDAVNVVGKEEPVAVYELLGYPGEIDGELRSVVERYTLGLGAYRNQIWDEAISHFSSALSLDPTDGPSQVLLDRCKDYKVTPPGKDWDGAFTMVTK